jgi:hypothetical protein
MELPEGKAFCGYCGVSLTLEPEQEPVPILSEEPVPEEPKDVKLKEIERKDRKPADPQPDISKQKTRPRTWIWWVIGIAGGAVVSVLGYFLVRGILSAETDGQGGTTQLPTSSSSVVASTARPESTSASAPQSTATYEAEPIPVPEWVSESLSGLEIRTQNDDLHTSDISEYSEGSVSRQGGYLRFQGGSTENEASWGYFNQFQEGEAVLIEFRFSEGCEFVIDFRSNHDVDATLMQWGFVRGSMVQTVEMGVYLPNHFWQGYLVPESNTWYYALLAIDPDSRFLILVWDEGSDTTGLDRQYYGQAWWGLEWDFHVWLFDGYLDIARMDTYSFSEVLIE